MDPLIVDELYGHLLIHGLNINSQLLTFNLLEQILPQDMETPVVVVAVTTLFNLAVGLPLAHRKILEAMGVEMVLQQTVPCVKFATNLVIRL